MLNDKQKAFCEEYIIDFKLREAAIRAGYKPTGAHTMAYKLINNPEVIAYVNELKHARSERLKIDQDRVLLEIARLAFNDPRRAFDGDGNLLPIKDWPDEVAAAVSSIKITENTFDNDTGKLTTVKEIKFWDKNKPLEMAGRHLVMFTDTLKHQGDEVKFSVQLLSYQDAARKAREDARNGA